MKIPYETMFLMPPTISEEKIDAFIDRLQEVVVKKQGEVTNVNKMGVRKTAYVVDKMNSAYYILLQYRGIGETIHEVERMLKNSDEVKKYLSTKITTKPSLSRATKAKSGTAAEEVARQQAEKQKDTETANNHFQEPDLSASVSINENGAQE